MPIVVDASVSMSWILDDEDSTYAADVLMRVVEDGGLVPRHWILEITNAIVTAIRRGRLETTSMSKIGQLLKELPIDVAQSPTLEYALGPLTTLAHEQKLSAYDAAYLDLALREGLALATLDDRLRAAAGNVGVPVHE